MSKIEEKASVERKNLPERIRNLLSYLKRDLYGKDEAVRLALLSAVAGESIFFLGLPGTAKSMISRRIAAAFSDFYRDGVPDTENGGYFEYLMNEFSTPDEICGPVDLSALNEKPSRYIRQTAGYLPSAKVAFLDEIWKSGPAILNTLLTIVNERIFHNGNRIEKVPLVSLAAASNELPEKNRGLEALWDRFILRVPVNPVSNEEDFFKVVDGKEKKQEVPAGTASFLLSFSEVESWQSGIDKIKLGGEVKNVITSVRKELALRNSDKDHGEDKSYYVSDRRWKKIVRILKTSAFLNGRESVDLMDCTLIGYCIWNSGEQYEESLEIIGEILRQYGEGFYVDIDEINEQIKNFHDSILKLFYKTEEDRFEVEKVVMADGTETCELVRSVNLPVAVPDFYGRNRRAYYNIRFIAPNGDYYSVEKNRLAERGGLSLELDIPAQKLSWINSSNNVAHECPVKFRTIKGKGQIKNQEVFDNRESFEFRRKKADTQWYEKILDAINAAIKEVNDFKAAQSRSFKENIFVEEHFCDLILSPVNDSLKQLEDAVIRLKKERRLYAAQEARHDK